jgi:hypothetical protein
VVLTDTPDEVAIEFPMNGNLSDATALAEQACAKHGRIARFGVVKTAATPTTRVAKYRCVSATPAVAATPPATEASDAATDSSAGEPPAVSSEPPEDQPSVTSETSGAAPDPTTPAETP